MTFQQRQTPTSHCTLCSKKPTPLLPQGIDSTPHTMRLCIRCQNLHHRGPSERDTSFTFQSDNSSSRIPPSSCNLPTSRSEEVALQQLEPRLPALALCSRKRRKWMSNFSLGHVGSNINNLIWGRGMFKNLGWSQNSINVHYRFLNVNIHFFLSLKFQREKSSQIHEILKKNKNIYIHLLKKLKKQFILAVQSRCAKSMILDDVHLYTTSSKSHLDTLTYHNSWSKSPKIYLI